MSYWGDTFESDARKYARKARRVADREHVPADDQEALVEMAALLERYAMREESERNQQVAARQRSLAQAQQNYWPNFNYINGAFPSSPRPSLSSILGWHRY